ncbi:LacI family DNA-binding transcriptional regulator [Moellerella wisconsensis]|uniref:LacI family sucrose operon repressor n=1 Tax=Moellerella wisconsensis ATCC 35017 TaxID=1354267 RepID=A0A0N0IB05_9GAMM|nr:LacI family DNA-binding transcriptional regulator [Moellerella wisconsensis]KPD03191.1 LacI family sucrose operon repressor [Moellerella wisconsensis ATCC 35017]VFS48974.1 Catabolite control protein [Moellerella wisconsensis]
MNIKEIAKLAKTSASSVSRVINSSGYVKEEVRQRINKVLEETGYRPNAFAKALHSKKSHTIGVILPKINATSSGECVAGIDGFFSAKGYSILLGNTHHQLNKELEFLDIFKEKQVDGVIFIATVLTPEHHKKLQKLAIPTVIIGQESPNNIPCVLFDEYHAAKEMTQYLLTTGKQRIAFIGVDESDISVGVHRRQGYLDALREQHIPIDEHLLAKGDFTHQSGFAACRAIFEKNTLKPDAIFAANDKMAIGAMNYLFSMDLQIPRDISVCGVGGGTLAQFYHPQLTTLIYDYKQAGIIASDLLYRQINKDQSESITAHKTWVNYQLMIGKSTQ